jgi:hypothetical protein
MIFDPLYLLVIGVGAALSLWAQARVKGAFSKYSRIPAASGRTGAQVAGDILAARGVRDVRIEPVEGRLSDHYDPRGKVLRLSPDVYRGQSMAAFGIAAHEVGHALQDAQGYAPLRFRSAWVPVANIGSGLSWIVIILAFLMGGAATALGQGLAVAGVGLFATTTVFTLVTLPVEFDASKRALATLRGLGYVSEEEIRGARRVLNAAALTYVAAFVTSLLTLLYWLFRLGLLGGSRD